MKTWGEYPFEWVALIRPQTDAGTIREFIPHLDYQNLQGLSLNPYGHGPFCKFRIRGDKPYAGVYVLTVAGKVVYVGECINLSTRYNNGYGTISPRHCYHDGQPANCRINNLVYHSAKAGQQIELWFFKTANRRAIQVELIETLRPQWNRQGVTARHA